MVQDVRAQLRSLFYLDKLSMPERNPQMTAYEVGQRVQEYVRAALPIFEPMEQDYNGALCEETFDLIMAHGGFGPPHSMPDELSGADIKFTFKSPLHEAIEEQKTQKFLNSSQLIAQAAALDPGARFVVKPVEALRDALLGSGAPATWVNTVDEANALRDAEQQKAAQSQMLSSMEQASGVVKNLATAAPQTAVA